MMNRYWLPRSEQNDKVDYFSFDFKVSLYTLMQYEAEMDEWVVQYNKRTIAEMEAYDNRQRAKRQLDWQIELALRGKI